MRRLLPIAAAVVTALCWAAPARAELCGTCKGKPHTEDARKCPLCKDGLTGSGLFKMCRACSEKLKLCERCRAPLGATGPVKPTDGAGAIDLANGGSWSSGAWKYVLEVRAKGSRSEGRFGVLSCHGAPVPAAEINDHYKTPWGLMYWVGTGSFRWGDHGWMPRPKGGGPGADKKGKLLPAPAGPGAPPDGKPVQLAEGDSGKTVQIPHGGTVVVTLKGNPTTGYSWSLTGIQGDAVRLAGKPKYLPRPTPRPMVGSGGAFELTFTGVRPGTATVKLGYARPWEKGTPPIKTFTMTVVVGPAGGAADEAKLTARRSAALRADPENFRMHLTYVGDQDKPFYALLVVGAKPKSGSPGLNQKGFDLTVYATKRQVEKLIEHLAESGCLGKAQDALTGPIDPVQPPAYLLRVTGGPKAGAVDLRAPLGWDKPMFEKLDALRKPMFGPTAEGMDKLLGRLSGYRK